MKKYLVLFSLFLMNLVDQPTPEVKIDQGVLTGKVNNDGTIFEYIGIPYATADKRFQAPGPPPAWNGTYKAIDDIYSCPQSTSFGILGTEDCFKINVYVPAFRTGPLPVMVWIHGGAFILGSGGKMLYDPDFIIKKDVILVTFNYRLGALGFMCLRIPEAPGNAGIKDQVAALRWVKKNIAAFGGDPDNITLFGESAGGASTSILLASNATNGLFNRAIVQSGSSMANWAINRNPVWVASLLAKELGYDTEDPKELYKIFANMNSKDLTALKTVKPLDLFTDTLLLHLPCIEKELPGVESVINKLPYELFKNNPKDIPVIYGSTSREGLFLIAEETEKSIDEMNGRYLFASDLHFPTKQQAMTEADKVKKFYFDDDKISITKIMNVSDLYTQLYFELPVIMEAELLMSKIKSPVYNYVFNHSGHRNFMKKRSGYSDEPGACHGDELPYLFNGYFFTKKIDQEDGKIIDYMTTMWTNFAKYGNPTPHINELPVRWEQSTKQNLNFLYIENELRLGSMPNPKGYRLWKDIYDKYRDTNI